MNVIISFAEQAVLEVLVQIIQGFDFILAWRRVISNNSYKFSRETVEGAAEKAGLSNRGFLQTASIALFIAQQS